MREIALSQGRVALVDDDDYDTLSKRKWYFDRYAWSFRVREDGSRQRIAMHREILELEHGDGKEVDHRDGNKLNNQKSNLRLCSRRENNGNSKSNKGLSRYKGVSLRKDTGKWRAYGTEGNKYVTLGSYATEEEAAIAYDEWAIS